jgi:hypothetical protein
MTRKTDAVEMNSGTLQAELIEIKERLGSLETIASLANRKEVEIQARGLLTTAGRRDVMRACETPKTREQLKTELQHPNVQGVDHHLNPLRGGDLIHQRTDERGVLTFEWSRLFRSLPKQTKIAILGALNDGKGKRQAKEQH